MRKIVYIGSLVALSFMSCHKPITEKPTTPISPYLFGQNLWLTDGAEGRKGYIEESLWQKVEASGVKIIRIGGNGYEHAMPGIDTLERWVKAIKAIGAEPLFQVSRVESSEKAAALVQHFNKNTDLYIKYWSIGNEAYQIGKWSIDTISFVIKRHATAMKMVDPTIKIFASDEAAYYTEVYDALLLNDKLSIAGRDSNGHWYIDGVTFHNYPNSRNYTRTDVINYSVSKMRGMVQNLMEDVAASNLKYQRFGDDKLLWGITEFNITYDNPTDLSVEGIAVPSFINGQFWVDVFGIAMEYGAFCVTPWCIQESDRPSTYFGYIGGPPNFTPHSTYYHLQLMSENMKGSYIKMTTNSAFVKAFGSQTNEETTVLLMNQDALKLYDFDLNQMNKPSTGLSIASVLDFKANLKGTINPNVTMVMVFNKKGELKKQLLYSMEMAAKNEAPKDIKMEDKNLN